MTSANLQQKIEQVYHQYFSDFPIFSVTGDKVVGRFFKFELHSYFEPIHACADGLLLGHHAHLLATGPQQASIATPRLFALANDSSALVTLDRMVRTLHLLNYLAIDKSQSQTLFLSVDTALLGAVKERHGQFFEHLLRQLGSNMRKIVISLGADTLADIPQLSTAIHNYREHGFGIALTLPQAKRINASQTREMDVDYLFLDQLGDKPLALAENADGRLKLIHRSIGNGDPATRRIAPGFQYYCSGLIT